MADTVYAHRFLAKIVVEALTPLAVSSGIKEVISDALVVTDVNGFPYLPATSIAGVIRHEIDDEEADKFFGYPRENESKDGHGSNIIFTSAQMVGEDGKVIDGLIDRAAFNSEFYKRFDHLPVRQHVKISHKGASDSLARGKFDEQVVYKGTRFCFEIEMVSIDPEQKRIFETVLEKLAAKSFSVGSGSRGGLGKLEIKKDLSKVAYLDLTNKEHLEDYITDKSSYLSDEKFWSSGKSYIQSFDKQDAGKQWIEYSLTLQPDDFFLFGSGMGNEKANVAPVTESYIEWSGNTATFVDNNILIPATSLKGALSHRIAFHYNKLTGQFADDKATCPQTGSNNPAVYALFGSEDAENPQIGNVLFFDIIEKPKTGKTKILNHVAIDRFTGGTMDGALFSEEVNCEDEQVFPTRILLNKDKVKKVISEKFSESSWKAGPEVKPETVFKSLKLAIDDLCNGMLPLGGGVNRGNGCFKGECNPQIDE